MSPHPEPETAQTVKTSISESPASVDPESPLLTESVVGTGRILERIYSGIAIVGADLTILWHNRALADLCEGSSLVGMRIYQALGCKEIQGPEYSPFTECLNGVSRSRTEFRLRNGRHFEVVVQSLDDSSSSEDAQLLCIFRDTTAEVKEHKKLMAIHRAGLELSNLTPDELARMSTAERIDLLKANILQYSLNILNFEKLEIRLLDPHANVLEPLLSEGMTEAASKQKLLAEPTGNGVTGFVAATGKRYLCDDTEHDPHYIPGAIDARSSLTVPVVYRERVIGTFNVESPKPRNFSDRDGEFLEVFAREIGMALHTLELLQVEKRIGGSASVEAIVREVSLPVDAILSDAIRMLECLERPMESQELAHDLLRRVLRNARVVKSSIRKVGDSFGPQPAAAVDSSAEQGRLAGLRVLLVDSDPSVRRSAHWLLGSVGCEIDSAQDGQEALTFRRTIGYDVIVADIRLPDMNGYELYHRLRQESPSTPVVLMTGFGYDAGHCMVKARQDGLRAVLYKPFRLDRLCEAIENSLDRRTSNSGSVSTASPDAKVRG